MPRFNVADYVDVQARINRFWSEYPDGRIATTMLSDVNKTEGVVFVAEVYKNAQDANPASSGYAQENRGTTPSDGANFTSWVENCETSAIGRALANMGYATTGADRPSAQEMSKVNRGLDAIIESRRAPQS